MISQVSDTAFWVASFRAMESNRIDSLFKDPLAELLTSEKGLSFTKNISKSQYVAWTVVIRTKVIDEMINSLIAEGVDTIINLGAGLDTRPYRMGIPKKIRWIEVDHVHLIDFKNETLKNEVPTCRLERWAIDLTKLSERQSFFTKINSEAKKTLIITEGVIPYLSEEQVQSLGNDLHAQNSFRFWITEYHSKEMYRHLQSQKRKKEMINAPFLFFPKDWLGFFNQLLWKEKKIVYLVPEAKKWGRNFPTPWWGKILHLIAPAKIKEGFQKMSGFIIFESK